MPGLVTTRRSSGGSGVVSGSGGSRGASNQLAGNRQAEIDKILKLFKDFGVSAKQDIDQVTRDRKAGIEVDAINRGLSNLTIRQPLLGETIRQGEREKRRVDETVASQEAQFRASQLIDPGLIAQLTQGAAAAGSGQPVRATLGAGSSFTRPNLAESIRNQGRGGGSVNSTSTSSPGVAGGSPGSGARIVTRGGSFTPQEFGQQQGQGPSFNPNQPQGGAQQPQTQPGTTPTPGQEQASKPQEPKREEPGNQGFLVEVPTFTDVPGVVTKKRQIVSIPAGMSFEQGIAAGLIPNGAVRVG